MEFYTFLNRALKMRDSYGLQKIYVLRCTFQ